MNVGSRYDENAQRYVDHVGREFDHASLARAGLRLFAELAAPDAVAVDVGCGPGHVTAYLAAAGMNISGLDISARLLDIAASTFPDIDFGHGDLTALPLGDASVDAVVSRHSVIHTPPEGLPRVAAEFARVLAPGGLLFMSFFATDGPNEHGQPFDHAVCTAYQIDADQLADLLAVHGLDEEMRLVRRARPDERSIPHATLIARRRELDQD